MRLFIKSFLIITLLSPFTLSAALASTPTPILVALPMVVSHSTKPAAFQTAMRKLWEDHIIWTRLFIVSTVANLPDKEATTKRLLQNQEDIGDAITPYYGEAAGKELTSLLKQHITIAVEVVAAAKSNNDEKLHDANKRWFNNADEIVIFLHEANPQNWPITEMHLMMYDHLNVTNAEVAARLKGDWSADIAAYEKVYTQMLRMADILSAGILKQFPEKF